MENSQRPVCPLCGSCEADKRFRKNGYDHFDCRSCTALYVHPLPTQEELARIYEADAEEPNSRLCWTSSRRHVWGTWRWTFRLIENLAGHGPLLDAGCGGGQFLAFAGGEGWEDLVGVEVSSQAAAVAREMSGAAIHETPLLATDLPAESFSGVTLWDVLEHLRDVRPVLREMRRVLRPGGVLVISVPHRKGLVMRLLRERALIVMPPEHLTYHTRRSMRRLLESEGFTVKSLRCTDLYLREWVRLLSRKRGNDADRPAEPPAGEDQTYRRWYERLTDSRAFLGAMRIANVFLNLTGLGDHLIAVAQKPRS